jgi:filamentous hemagglutinin
MTQQIINVGTSANDGQGDPLRTAFIKCNNNFSQLYSVAQTSPPPTLTGRLGDFAGMYAYDSTYFYYCFANYTGNSTIWAQITQVGNIQVSAINNGTSNVKINGLNANATININGTGNVAVFANTGAFVTGVVSVSGNVRGGNINTAGDVSATGNVNASTLNATTIAVTGNITGNASITANNIVSIGYLNAASGLESTGKFNGPYTDGIVVDYDGANSIGRISVGPADSIRFYNGGVGNVAIVTFSPDGNIATSGTFNSTGNIKTQAIISASGNIVTAGYFVGNFAGNITGNLVVPGANTQVLFNTNGNTDAVAGMTYNKDANTFVVLGIVSAQGNVIGGNITTAGNISATANITGGNFLTAGIMSSTGNATHGNVLTAGIMSSTGNATHGNILTAGLISAAANITGGNLATAGQVSATANITGGNVLTAGLISSTGNITGGNVSVGNNINVGGNLTMVGITGTRVSVTANVTGGNILTAGIVSSTGNITANYFLGNGSQLSGLPPTNLIQSGNSNVLIGSSGGNVSINVSGVSPVVLVTPVDATVYGNLIATGNTTGGNILTAGLISAVSTITSGDSITGANLLTGGLVSSTGNIIGGNILTLGLISSTGNITGGNLSVGTAIIANIQTITNGIGNIGNATNTFNTVFARATTAQYADLAEKYLADAEYAPGTVLSFGGSAEVTVSTQDHDTVVAGVVSTDPAYCMNSGLTGNHVVTLALVGRVPCQVQGPVTPGAMMVSAGNGRARAEANPAMGAVIGKAVQAFNGEVGTIEIVVGRL